MDHSPVRTLQGGLLIWNETKTQAAQKSKSDQLHFTLRREQNRHWTYAATYWNKSASVSEGKPQTHAIKNTKIPARVSTTVIKGNALQPCIPFEASMRKHTMHNPRSGCPFLPPNLPLVTSPVGNSTTVHDQLYGLPHHASGWNTPTCDVTQGVDFWLANHSTYTRLPWRNKWFLNSNFFLKLPLPVLDMRWQFCAITFVPLV